MASIISQLSSRLAGIRRPGSPGWTGATAMIRDRAATAFERSDSLRAAYARGKAAGRMVRSGSPSDDPAATGLRAELSRLLLAEATGERVSTGDRRALRKLAVESRKGDPDGLSIAALSVLADRFDDRAARAWLPVALAEAGRFTEAARLDPSGPPGPRPLHYPILVTAAHQLGGEAAGRERLEQLTERFPELGSAFTDIWGADPVSRHYRRLFEQSPAHDGRLPVFQHLPFCAGTSMQFSLALVVPWARTLQVGRRRGLLQLEQARRADDQLLQSLMMVHQHHPYALSVRGRRLTHFTVLRDPVSQIRSGFFKRSTRDKIVSTRDRGSADFVEHADYLLGNGLTNLLSRMIVTTHPDLAPLYRREFRGSGAYTLISHEEDMFYLRVTRRLSEGQLLRMARETLDENFAVVGTMAHLAASHLACTAAVGVPIAHTIAHRGRSGQPPNTEPPAVERRLREANSVDQQLFDDYTARFERDHADLIRAVEDPDAARTDQIVSSR